MKNPFYFSFLMWIIFTSNSFSQFVQTFDNVNIVDPGVEEVILDISIINNLESFNDKDDAIIYIYRLSSIVGGAVKWQIKFGENEKAKLGQKEYLVIHINTTENSHWITFPDMKFNFINFKPNRYYMIRLKGFKIETGYFDANTFNEIKSFKRCKT